MPGIGVIVNPHAGRNRRQEDRLRKFEKWVGSAGVVAEPKTLDDLEEFARELHEQRVDILAVCGGDGSFFRAWSALIRAYGEQTPLPAFLPLRGGSMNTIARSVGVRRGSPEAVLQRVVDSYRAGRPLRWTERHLIRVEGNHFGFMVGAGVIVNFLRVYYGGRRVGPAAAAYWLGRAILSSLVRGDLAASILRGFQAEVDCDGERVPHRNYNVLYASTIEDIGLGFSATYLAIRKRGFFHLLAGQVGAAQVMLRLGRLRQGCPLRIPSLYDNLARIVMVEFEEPTHYMIDGDVLQPVLRLRCETGPRLRILVG